MFQINYSILLCSPFIRQLPSDPEIFELFRYKIEAALRRNRRKLIKFVVVAWRFETMDFRKGERREMRLGPVQLGWSVGGSVPIAVHSQNCTLPQTTTETQRFAQFDLLDSRTRPDQKLPSLGRGLVFEIYQIQILLWLAPL